MSEGVQRKVEKVRYFRQDWFVDDTLVIYLQTNKKFLVDFQVFKNELHKCLPYVFYVYFYVNVYLTRVEQFQI